MTFNDDYKNQINKIKADGYLKDRVLKTLDEREKKRRFKPVYVYRTAAALALCAAVVFSCTFLKDYSKSIAGTTPADKVMIAPNDYSEIYKTLSKINTNVYYGALDKAETADTGALNGAPQTTKAGASANPGNEKPTAVNGTARKEASDRSDTNVQVDGVDEADIVKTDGKRIYSISRDNNKAESKPFVAVTDITGEKPVQIGHIELKDRDNIQDMYLSGNRLVILGVKYTYSDSTAENGKRRAIYSTYDCLYAPPADTVADVYDISDPQNIQLVESISQNGNYETSRLIGDKLYLISTHTVTGEKQENKPETFVPSIICKNKNGAVDAASISVYDTCTAPTYTVISGYSIKDGALCGTQSVLGSTFTVYCSTENIITAAYSENADNTTELARFSLKDGVPKLLAHGNIKGSLLNQFSIDEYNGYFRFVTTYDKPPEVKEFDGVKYYSKTTENSTVNNMYVLDSALNMAGKIENIAPGERVYSVRFMGETAYFVTFRQVDPLFSVDLSDPKAPKIIGSLKIPGFSDYLHPFGENKLLGIGRNADEKTGRTGSVKLSMFDISDPSNVTESAKQSVDTMYSEALYNHKAILCDYGKNLICFSGQEEISKYFVYSFKDGVFVKKAEIKFNIYEDTLRGLYVSDKLYLITSHSVSVYSLNDFSKLSELTLK